MIPIWQAATVLVGILVLMGLVSVVLGLLATRRHFAKKFPPAFPEPAPKISILKPVEGAGPNTYEAFASFCRLDYPGDVEIIIGTIRQDDPVVAVVRTAAHDFSRTQNPACVRRTARHQPQNQHHGSDVAKSNRTIFIFLRRRRRRAERLFAPARSAVRRNRKSAV